MFLDPSSEHIPRHTNGFITLYLDFGLYLSPSLRVVIIDTYPGGQWCWTCCCYSHEPWLSSSVYTHVSGSSRFDSVPSLRRVQPFGPRGLQHAKASHVLHRLPAVAETHVHRVDGAIQPSHPLSSPSPPSLNLSQHRGLFQWVSSLHQVANVLEIQLQHQSFWWIFRVDFLQDWLVAQWCDI